MKDKNSSVPGCVVLLLIHFFCGGLTVNYSLEVLLGKTLPFFWAGVVGIIAAEISIPLAVVLFILRSFGIV